MDVTVVLGFMWRSELELRGWSLLLPPTTSTVLCRRWSNTAA
jgi:hypothetical protein